MKEIDFLPEWYRNGQRRRVSYRTQCIALGGVFVVMMVWSLAAKHSISKAEAELADIAANQGQVENVSVELAGLEGELKELRQRVQSMEEINSRIDVASILAELSYLIDERVVLSKVELIGEKFARAPKAGSQPTTNTVVRPVGTAANKKELPLGNVRFKVVMAGLAADASDVGVLMCKLEDSVYFRQVVLVFSRDTEIASRRTPLLETAADGKEGSLKTKDAVREGDAKVRASEFEIQCYLANYREQ